MLAAWRYASGCLSRTAKMTHGIAKRLADSTIGRLLLKPVRRIGIERPPMPVRMYRLYSCRDSDDIVKRRIFHVAAEATNDAKSHTNKATNKVSKINDSQRRIICWYDILPC